MNEWVSGLGQWLSPQPPLSCTESLQMPCKHRCHQLPAYTQDLPSLGGVGVPLPSPQHQGPCQTCSPAHINHPQKASPLPPQLPPLVPSALPACLLSSHIPMLSCPLTIWLVHCLKCICCPSCTLFVNWDFAYASFILSQSLDIWQMLLHRSLSLTDLGVPVTSDPYPFL